MSQSILIVGGGFAGIEAAKRLAKKNLPDTVIRILDPKTYFEYHAAFYRFITGRSPMESCISYADILNEKNIELIRDKAVSLDAGDKIVTGESGCVYHYDKLILALGSETEYFDIPGVEQYAFGMKTARDAAKLRTHIQNTIEHARSLPHERARSSMHIVVVGGGPSGVELAGELGWYVRTLSKEKNTDPSLVRIDLIEAAGRLLPSLGTCAARKAKDRLRSLGVHIFLNQSLVKEEFASAYLKHMELETKTVVWTAGQRGHHFYEESGCFTIDRKKRVEVDGVLRAKGQPNIFVLGDGAATKYSGMAQTALYDGTFVADVIDADRRNLRYPDYQPPEPVCIVPVGPHFAVAEYKGMFVTGRVGWIFRRLMDLRVFLRLLPFHKALRAFRSSGEISKDL